MIELSNEDRAEAKQAYERAMAIINDPDAPKPDRSERLRRDLLRQKTEALLQINQPGM